MQPLRFWRSNRRSTNHYTAFHRAQSGFFPRPLLRSSLTCPTTAMPHRFSGVISFEGATASFQTDLSHCLSRRRCSVATFFFFSASTFSSLVASCATTVWLNLFEARFQCRHDRTRGGRIGEIIHSRVLRGLLEFLVQKFLILLQTQTWVLDVGDRET